MAQEPDGPIALRARFLADLSHEVRSPLHAIIGFSELLTDEAFGPLNPDQKSVAQDIHSAAEHLLQLINDVLDLSRLQMAKLDLQIEVLSLAAVVERSVHIARGLAHEKRLALAAEVDPALAARADERRVLQVLHNLLANAIRYSPPGGTVTITARPEETVVWTLVHDQGPGIAPDDQERIFEPFVALEVSGIEPGAGLGLSVCQNLLHAMGGDIRVDSAPGQGATFMFSLPRAERPD
ncbi:HAMP domain-containing histidine kinase [bacterium]|nr:HAMP domain-containing histidine kinase [bacterium]